MIKIQILNINKILIYHIYFTALLQVDGACPHSGLEHQLSGGQTICYWLIVTHQTAIESENLCKAQGGYLAYIPDQNALDTVIQLKDDAGYQFGGEFYIGYTEENNVITIRGTNIVQSFHNWYSAQPDRADQDCISIFNRYADWYDEDCTKNYKAVCSDFSQANQESTESPTTTTTPETTTTAPLTTTTTQETTTTTQETTTTTSVTSTAQETSTSATTTCSKTCYCSCVANTSTKTVEEFTEEVKRTLSVNKATLSSSIRKKKSADDPRPSAAGMGSLAILILTLIIGLVVLMDSTRIYSACVKCYKLKIKPNKQSEPLQKNTTYVGIGSTEVF